MALTLPFFTPSCMWTKQERERDKITLPITSKKKIQGKGEATLKKFLASIAKLLRECLLKEKKIKSIFIQLFVVKKNNIFFLRLIISHL